MEETSNRNRLQQQGPLGEQWCNEPHLGLATTRQLLEELAARGRTTWHRYQMTGLELANTADVLIGRLPEAMLDYRTTGD